MNQIEGRFCALPTPFSDDGMAVSEIRLARMLRWLSQADLNGYLVAGEVGEFTAMAFSERKTFVEWVQRETRGALPLLVNVSSLSTTASVDLAQHAGRHGARAVVLRTPYFGDFNAEEEASFFKSVAGYGRLPVLAVGNVKPETKAALADVSSITFAPDTSTTSRFNFGALHCHPGFALGASWPDALETDSPSLYKAAYDHLGTELGPPRGPRLRCDAEGLALLQRELAPSLDRLSA